MEMGLSFRLLLALLVVSLSGYAQPGINEFYAASGEVHRWYFSLSDLSLVIGAITGILGGLRVYANWQMGKHHIDAQVMGWFFSCLFLLSAGVFLRGLFGL
jgi:hypothetical protein